jgi:nucleoside transporter
MTQPLSTTLNIRLSSMMFLQYAIWGAWLPLLWPFLIGHRGMTPAEVGNIFAIGAVGAIVAPFIAGQVADRWFSTEKFLGMSHLLGAVLIWQLANIESYSGFLWFSLGYSIIYSPTLSLTNSLAFHHLPDRDRDFGRVRVWGTVGWIAAGIAVGQWLSLQHSLDVDAGRADAFRLSAVLGATMGLFCFFLPHTPPSKGEQASATAEALGTIKKQPLLTLFMLAVPVSCIHQFYFVHTSEFLSGIQEQAKGFVELVNKVFGIGGGGLMTIGQMSEIVVLAFMPLFAKAFTRKQLLAVGLLAYAGRMALFAYADVVGLPWVLAGVALHGLCFGCFIFVAFMIVDEETTVDIRASAQSLFNLVIVGIGIIVGSKIASSAATWATSDDQLSYRDLFSYPMWASLVCLALLLFFYPGGRKETQNA